MDLVTAPLESAIMSVSGVDEIQSTSSESVSTIQITYEEGTDLDIAATKLREKFDMVSLPEDAADPMIININASELMPTAMIALMGEDLSQLQTLAEDEIAPALERIDGVAQVSVGGGNAQQIAVEIDPAKAAGFGLSNSYISQFLAGQNLLYPGGDLTERLEEADGVHRRQIHLTGGCCQHPDYVPAGGDSPSVRGGRCQDGGGGPGRGR